MILVTEIGPFDLLVAVRGWLTSEGGSFAGWRSFVLNILEDVDGVGGNYRFPF